jgi:hypothetical protein
VHQYGIWEIIDGICQQTLQAKNQEMNLAKCASKTKNQNKQYQQPGKRQSIRSLNKQDESRNSNGECKSNSSELATTELVDAGRHGKERIDANGEEMWIEPASSDSDLLSLLEAVQRIVPFVNASAGRT